jgi:hypothetical protein
MIRSYIRVGGLRGVFFLLVAGCLATMTISSQAQTTLNVANFGARGDAVQFFVNTSSNSVVVTTTNQLSSADIGKAIEIFGAGTPTTGLDAYGDTNGNQDMVATIINVVNGTNIYVSQLAQATLTNTFATYGTDNQKNFANAIAAASGTNTIIKIPAGNYLFLTTNVPNIYGSIYAGIVLYGGGIHFVGAGTSNTTLLSQGAWTLQGGVATRGMLFAIGTPITNDFPVSLENLTLDGGVQQGNTSRHGYPASIIDGSGWDGTHDAVEVFGGGGNMFTQMIWINVAFQHWRGEMVKSTDGSTNGNLSIIDCVFEDGNATAINIYPSLNISNCVFNTLFEVAEYYQAYSTNTSYFQDNLVTNMTGGLFAINGAVSNHVIPSFNIVSNIFYLIDENGIQTTPAQNVTIKGNTFLGVSVDGGNPITLGVSGYQGSTVNSNIVVVGNTFSNVFHAVSVYGSGGNSVWNLVVSNNVGIKTSLFGYNSGWGTNLDFYANVSDGSGLDSHLASGQWFLDDASDQFTTNTINDSVGMSNTLSYAYGMKWQINDAKPASVFVIDDANPQKIPPGAVMNIKNLSSISIPLYFNSALTLEPVTMANGQTIVANWNGSQWTTNSVADELPVPLGLAVRLQ